MQEPSHFCVYLFISESLFNPIFLSIYLSSSSFPLLSRCPSGLQWRGNKRKRSSTHSNCLNTPSVIPQKEEWKNDKREMVLERGNCTFADTEYSGCHILVNSYSIADSIRPPHIESILIWFIALSLGLHPRFSRAVVKLIDWDSFWLKVYMVDKSYRSRDRSESGVFRPPAC